MFENLTNAIPAGSRTGKFQLDPAGEALLDEFVVWLKEVDDKSTNTANSYRSYVAKAQALGQDWSEMTSDQRSAVRRLAAFLEQTQ